LQVRIAAEIVNSTVCMHGFPSSVSFAWIKAWVGRVCSARSAGVALLVCGFVSLQAKVQEHDLVSSYIERAYNFDLDAFAWFASAAFDKEEPLQSFIASTAAYWTFQADRTNGGKRDAAEAALSQAILVTETVFRQNRNDSFARFLYGSSRCNRARFHVEESNWFKAYLDAREGLGVLRSLISDDPEYADGFFAVGVAEAYLSDAPTLLKPLARLLGFRGSADSGIEKLLFCMENGDWTQTEAAYYLAYYYYNVARDGDQAVKVFERLVEQYPGNPIFLYLFGRSHQIRHDPLGALPVYERARDAALVSDANDIANWSLFRMGTIQQGEQRHQDAIRAYTQLQQRLGAESHRQEYFYLLPLKMAECLIEEGDIPRARAYLNVIRPEWDRETYRTAMALLRELDRR
jgi:tetratricopeptide (TPR) repeat protein